MTKRPKPEEDPALESAIMRVVRGRQSPEARRPTRCLVVSGVVETPKSVAEVDAIVAAADSHDG